MTEGNVFESGMKEDIEAELEKFKAFIDDTEAQGMWLRLPLADVIFSPEELRLQNKKGDRRKRKRREREQRQSRRRYKGGGSPPKNKNKKR